MKVLVTGAGGKTGQRVVQSLRTRGAAVRAWVRTPAHAAKFVKWGCDVIVGDAMEASLWEEAVAGVDAVYHIAPNMFPDEVSLGKLAIDAAADANVNHFVFHSVLHPQTEAMPHHWKKLRVEEYLFTKNLPFTILQPTAYMQNLLPQWTNIVEEGRLRQPYAPETRISLVDLGDVAEAAAQVLLEPGHAGATYELVGTPPLSQIEVAATFAQVLGRPVHAEAIPTDVWAQQAQGLSDYARNTLLAMFDYYERYGLAGNPNVLGWLLGRSPTTLKAFIQTSMQRLNQATA